MISVEFTETGLKTPTEQEIFNELFAMFDNAFGVELNKGLNTPQGQLVTSLTAILNDYNNKILYLYNELDPEYATTRMQDALGKLFFLTRKAGVDSTAEVTFYGDVGAYIPKDYILIDTNGNQWKTVEDSSIGEDGKATIEVKANGTYGADKNTITKFYSLIYGLDYCTNENAAKKGYPVESKSDFSRRVLESTQVNSIGMTGSLKGALFAINDVKDVLITQNVSDTEKTEKGVTLLPHSVYCCVKGGNDTEIAKAIFKKCNAGCDFNGSTEIEIEDEQYSSPRPKYKIKFQRPTNYTLTLKVTYKSGSQVTVEQDIQNALTAYLDAKSDRRIGCTIYALEFVEAINGAINGDNKLLDVQIKSNGQIVNILELNNDQYLNSVVAEYESI